MSSSANSPQLRQCQIAPSRITTIYGRFYIYCMHIFYFFIFKMMYLKQYVIINSPQVLMQGGILYNYCIHELFYCGVKYFYSNILLVTTSNKENLAIYSNWRVRINGL